MTNQSTISEQQAIEASKTLTTNGVIERDLGDESVLFLGVDEPDADYVEIFPNKQEATPIQRHTVVKRLTGLPTNRVTITTYDKMPPAQQQTVERKIQAMTTDSRHESRDNTDTTVPQYRKDKRRYKDAADSINTDRPLERSSAPIDPRDEW